MCSVKTIRSQLFIILSVLALTLAACDTGADVDPEQGAQDEGQTQDDTAETDEDGETRAEGGDGSLGIAWIHSNAAAQSEQRAKDGFESWLEDEGLDWEVTFSDSKGDASEIANNFENAVQRGADAIILSMADLRASEAALEAASENDIPVFTIDSGWVPGVVVDVTTNNYEMSAKISKYLVDRLEGEGKIIAFKMDAHHGVRKRGNTLDVVLEENPDIEVLAAHEIDYTAFFEDTQRTMSDFVTRFGEDIDAVWAGWDEPAEAAAQAARQGGLSDDDLFIVGFDGHPPAIDAIREGGMFVATAAQSFERMGSTIGGFIRSIVVDGQPAEEVVPANSVYLPAPLITAENLPEEGQLPWEAPDFYDTIVEPDDDA